MNLIAVDIGNTNISIALFLKDEQKYIDNIPGTDEAKVTACLREYWQEIPFSETAKEKVRDGVILATSVKPMWTDMVRTFIEDQLKSKLLIVGKDIPLPIKMGVDKPEKVGTDRAVTAAAAYTVVEGPVIVADIGTACTIDLVDQNGVFLGGVIVPGFQICSDALERNTAQLPKVTVKKPELPFGRNTEEAINCGLYYSIIGTLQEVLRRFSEHIGQWPQTIITGSGAKIIRDDVDFIDNYVPDLVIKGIALTYRKYIESLAKE